MSQNAACGATNWRQGEQDMPDLSGLRTYDKSNCWQHYGFQFRDITTPMLEDIPRYEGPENIFYYEQEDDLFAVQRRRNTWSYNIIRPMAIIGYSCQCTPSPFLSP